ncbi:MAG: hypothetical protein AAB500_01025 [Patescibacteria group bacterium]
MKRNTLALVALALVSIRAEAQQIPGVFTSMEACEASAEVYTPSFLSGHKPLKEGERIVTLEQRQCGEMEIAGGRWAIVAQATGTKMVARGSTITRRWDCGNGAKGFVIPETPAPQEQIPAPPPIAVIGRRSDTTTHVFTGQIGIKVDVTVRDSTQRPNLQMVSVPKGGGGAWCTRGPLQFGACLVGFAAVGYGGYRGIKALGNDAKAFIATIPPNGG